MRLLVVTPQLPFPGAFHGGGAYLAEFLRALGEAAEVTLLALVRPGERTHLTDLVPPLERLVPVAHLWNADMGALALLRNRLRLLGRVLGGLPLTAAKFSSKALRHALRAELAAGTWDAVLLEFSVAAQYLPLCGNVPAVLTDHEAGGEGPAWQRFVHRFYPRARLLQAVTEEDAAILAREFPNHSVAVRPLVVPLPAGVVQPAKAPPRIGFLGYYLHRPNLEAAIALVRDVFPLIRREVPDAELLLAGEAAPPEVAAMAAFPGVRFLGRVPSTEEFFSRLRCLAAPLYSGRGGRVKVLSALAHGLPVVTNALGARGLSGVGEAALTVREGAAELAHAAVRFLKDPAAAATGGAMARQWCQTHLDPEAIAREQVRRIEQLVAR
jgi:glycosyltransferase involved in cell wall biosynthesis